MISKQKKEVFISNLKLMPKICFAHIISCYCSEIPGIAKFFLDTAMFIYFLKKKNRFIGVFKQNEAETQIKVKNPGLGVLDEKYAKKSFCVSKL